MTQNLEDLENYSIKRRDFSSESLKKITDSLSKHFDGRLYFRAISGYLYLTPNLRERGKVCFHASSQPIPDDIADNQAVGILWDVSSTPLTMHRPSGMVETSESDVIEQAIAKIIAFHERERNYSDPACGGVINIEPNPHYGEIVKDAYGFVGIVTDKKRVTHEHISSPFHNARYTIAVPKILNGDYYYSSEPFYIENMLAESDLTFTGEKASQFFCERVQVPTFSDGKCTGLYISFMLGVNGVVLPTDWHYTPVHLLSDVYTKFVEEAEKKHLA